MLLKDLYFPLALLPSTAVSSVARAPGCIDLMELMVTIQADMSDPFVHPDPGSRLWLISNALDTSTELPDRTSNQKTITAPTFDIPSHPHHSPNDDDEELPEDRFHRKDASSSYILQQREEGLSKAKSKRDASAVSDGRPAGTAGGRLALVVVRARDERLLATIVLEKAPLRLTRLYPDIG